MKKACCDDTKNFEFLNFILYDLQSTDLGLWGTKLKTKKSIRRDSGFRIEPVVCFVEDGSISWFICEMLHQQKKLDLSLHYGSLSIDRL
jgi:hypothetical protein